MLVEDRPIMDKGKLGKMVRTVKKIAVKNKEYFKCKDCGLRYDRRIWAEKCEAWCKEHHSCNIEITSHAMGGS